MDTAFHAFLSHRYKSPDVNEYFYEICATGAAISFEVDAANGATNVTRLQRMIRGCHGFIGVYPLEWSSATAPARNDLRSASKYFRLELGLAVRARKPILVFADRRFGTTFDVGGATVVEFDHDEVTGGGSTPSRARFAEECARFLARVQAGMAYDVTQATPWRTNRVGILLPPDGPYSAEMREALNALLDAAGGEVSSLAWQPSIDVRLTSEVDACDWVIADLDSTPQQRAIASFLEGWGAPLLRLRHAVEENADASPVEQALYGAYEVGFAKDIVRWSTAESLIAGVTDRLSRIQQPSRRISTSRDARRYFHSAAPRTERIFISYRGTDASIAAPIVELFGRRFQQVFDYKDGESIRAGRPWLDEIFDSLDRSSLAVLLLSPDYLASQNCVHEAHKAIELHDAGRLRVLPVKLANVRSADLPAWLTELQAATYTGDPPTLVESAIALLADEAAAGSHHP